MTLPCVCIRSGDNHDVLVSQGVSMRYLAGQLRGDRLLVGDQEPPLGSHLVTPRRGYLHHGIYVGARKVVHYSGLMRTVCAKTGGRSSFRSFRARTARLGEIGGAL